MEPNRTVAQKAIVGAKKDGRSSRVNNKMQRGRKKERERERERERKRKKKKERDRESCAWLGFAIWGARHH
jgi:hypothetical protein